MKVKLIQTTQNPIDVMWTAARTCYASESPIDMWENIEQSKQIPQEELYGTLGLDDYIELKEERLQQYKETLEKHWKLVQKVLNSGHQSIAEHVYFTFAIEGISRACSHQLVRHRHCTFSQQSQRYVEIKESFNELIDLRDKELKTTEDERQLMEICQKYFVDVNAANYKNYLDALVTYLYEVQVNKSKPEDARKFLPNATKTNLVMTMNFRELMHICNERLCTRAQTEIRQLTKLMVEEVKKQDGRLSQYLVPKCELDGFCKEHKCCGRKPTLKSIKEQL